MIETVVTLKELFNERGYKLTLQREKIFVILMEQGVKHFKAGDVYALVKEIYPDIGMATIYRTLLIFEELNIINKLGPDDEFNRYEFNISNDNHGHHHLICIKCGQIKDVKESFMDEKSEKILKKYDFIVNGYNQKLYGICGDCLRKEL